MTGLDLRPLSLAEILDRTFLLYRRHFLLFTGISAIPHLLTLAVGLLQVFFVHSPTIMGPDGRPQFRGFGLALISGLAYGIVAMFVYLWSQGATIFAVTDLYLGRQTSISVSLRRVGGKLGTLLGVILLNGLATSAAALLLIVPGIYVACRLLVCVPPALVEGRGPSDSLSRSWNLTRDYAGRAFLLYLLYLVLSIGLSLIVETPLTLAVAAARSDPSTLRLWMAIQQVLSVAIDIVIIPFVLIGTSVFYFDLRVRKEAFDLQFMMDPTSERVAGADGSVPSILS